MEKNSWLLCLRGGQVLKEVGLDLQKQVRVGLYDNAERAFLDAQLDRKVLKGVAIGRKDPAAFLRISKLIIIRPRLDTVDLFSKLHRLQYIRDLSITVTVTGTGTGVSVRLPASKVESELKLGTSRRTLGSRSWYLVSPTKHTKILLNHNDVNN